MATEIPIEVNCVALANAIGELLSRHECGLQQQLTIVGLACASLLSVAEESEDIVDDVTARWLDWIRQIIPECRKHVRAVIGENVVLPGPDFN